MNINISNSSKFSHNNINNIAFEAHKCKYPTRWAYGDWLEKTMAQLPSETQRELMEIYGGPKRASSLEEFAENIKGLFYPITRFCSNIKKLFTGKNCIKVVENPHKYPYATREEFYSDGSKKEIQYGPLKELIYMWEINKDGKRTRSVEYNWNFEDYTVRIYDENCKVKKIYTSVKHPYYSHLKSS